MKNIESVKRQIKDSSLVISESDEFNRKLMEQARFKAIIDVEKGPRKDGVKSLDSGINHVLAAIARKRSIAFAADLKGIKHLDKKDKAVQLARIRQNIRLCRKQGAIYTLINADKREIAAIMLSLGASNSQVKKAQSF